MDFTFTPHALEELANRDIPVQLALAVLREPEQIVAAKGGRSAYQSRVTLNNKDYLLRLIVEPDGMVISLPYTF
jgi:hypothetical protein